MRKVLIVLVGALATGAILAGCGGDDDDSSGDTQTKEEVVAQADKACAKANKKLDQAGQNFGNGPPSKKQLQQFATDTLVPNIQGQIDAIRAAGIPEGDQEQINATLDDAEQALNELRDDPSQLTGGPASQKLNKAGKELKEFGFEDCGS